LPWLPQISPDGHMHSRSKAERTKANVQQPRQTFDHWPSAALSP